MYVGLTHEQLLTLRHLVKDSGTGVQGHSRSPTENARALLHIQVHQLQGMSYDAAVKVTASAELASPTTLRDVTKHYLNTGTLPTPSTERRGRGNPVHPLHSSNTDTYGPSFEAELLMHHLVHAQKTDGVLVTSPIIAAELHSRLGIQIHCITVQRWLHSLGYQWRNKRYVGGMKPQAKHARIRQFILEYAAAVKEADAGTAIIVYMDESYIHTHHASKKGWFRLTDCDVLGDGDGKRLIILHAMTDNGLLCVPDAVASNWLSEPALTAELVFEEVLEDGQDDSDYHNTITGAKFVAWLRHRLLPTFAEMYPGKKMYMVLDNATYHCARDETWVSCSKAQSKHELAHLLLDLGVPELITDSNPPRTIPAEKFAAKVSEGGPCKNDMVAAVRKWLDAHPDHNRTVVEQVMSDPGHELIYTPPFCPEVQPIELLWAEVKRYVAERSTLNRSLLLTREQTEEAFQMVTKMFCNSIVKHCHDWMDQFIQSEEAGDLRQCGTLAGVIKSLQLLKLTQR
jgi:transposase